MPASGRTLLADIHDRVGPSSQPKADSTRPAAPLAASRALTAPAAVLSAAAEPAVGGPQCGTHRAYPWRVAIPLR
jgi:hypothetical protein